MLVDADTQIVQFKNFEPLNMLRNRICNMKTKYKSNIDPNTDDLFVLLEGEEKSFGKLNTKTGEFQTIEYKLKNNRDLFRIIQDDNFVVLLSIDTGVEILHKNRNFESEILKKGEQIDGELDQTILRNGNTLFVRTYDP